MNEQPTPVTEDVHATVPDLIARAHADFQHNQGVVQAHDNQGGTGQREGVLPGGTR